MPQVRLSLLVWIAACALALTASSCGKTSADAQVEDPKPADPKSTPASAPPAAQAAKATLGAPAPDFTLTALDGAKVSLSEHKGKIVVLEWFNPDCPFVKAAHGEGSLKGFGNTASADEGVVWLAVNSNAAGKQGHGPEANTRGREKFGIAYPILLDPDGMVGKRYDAQRTPQMYVIDAKGNLAYRGALDNTGSGVLADAEGGLVNYVAQAIDALKAGKPVPTAETKPYGCSVKY